MLNPSWAVLNHTEEEDLMGTASTLTLDRELVIVPTLGPLLRVLIDVVEEEMMEKPNVARNGWVESTIGLQVEEEVLPFQTEPVSDIIPEPFDSSIMDTPTGQINLTVRSHRAKHYLPSPNVGASIETHIGLHPLCNLEILRAVISAHTAGNTVDSVRGKKEGEDGICAIVVAGSDGCDEA